MIAVTQPRPRVLSRCLVPTSDGQVLCTDVYLPSTDGPSPSVVMRTPYGRNRPFMMWLAQQFNKAGINMVTQDCRGRYLSTGHFRLEKEEGDTLDTLRWIGEQPWSAGKVVLIGASMSTFANVRVAALAQRPVELAGVVNMMPVLDGHSLFFRGGGALLLHWALPWCTLMSQRHAGRSSWLQLPWTEIFQDLPVIDLAERVEGLTDLWRWALEHVRDPDAWTDLTTFNRLELVNVPMIFLCGWHDFMLSQTLLGFDRLKAHGASRVNLILGDWSHQTLFNSFGSGTDSSNANPTGLDLLGVLLDWVATQLGQARTNVLPAVLLNILGDGRWLASKEFPPAQSVSRRYHLTSSEQSERRLLQTAPIDAGTDRFTYDPTSPVPTIGGAVWPFDAVGLAAGNLDQRALHARSDVIVYRSEILAEDLLVIGSTRAHLWVHSSAPSTDFTVKLLDFATDGSARIIQDGISRVDTVTNHAFADHCRAFEVTIETNATAYRVEGGHRLGLEVSSSNFPKFDRNLNTGARYDERPSAPVPADQTIFHGGQTQSWLDIPTLPESAARALHRDQHAATTDQPS